MVTVVVISTVAVLVAVVGCAVIWRLDIARADEIEHLVRPVPVTPHQVGSSAPTALPPTARST